VSGSDEAPREQTQVCVCGWYYRPDFYEALRSVSDRVDITVVANRGGDTRGLRTLERENIGLEWGAFCYFLIRAWNAIANVVFLHDDTYVTDRFWGDVERIAYDQAFIFRDVSEYESAYSHGRAHFASARFLALVRASGGIWFDPGNRGFIAAGHSWSEAPPPGCLDHNAGIRAYTELVKRIGVENPTLSVNREVYSESVYLGRRGRVQSPAEGAAVREHS
jgi:hypothetical protein